VELSLLPVVAIAQSQGQALLADLAAGPVSVRLEVGAYSRNVIAEPPGRDCQTISGGHYDSVVAAPGANDNASGTAVVLEMALIMASRGFPGDHCFVLFGAEEVGLIGSRAYVGSLGPDARARLKAMLNFDMEGVGDSRLYLIGSPDLVLSAQQLAARLGIEAVQPPYRNDSDTRSFEGAGIPVLWAYRGDDALFHTPRDTADRIQPQFLLEAARLGLAVLDSLGHS
jgi:aminopeptidase YwaD